ncbi:MAG: hypothetical protein LBK95_10655, partial [Bifidobacteriaceae bacterium]|nr:hypothetical protein [Bifidobacteriaceae bacterium]
MADARSGRLAGAARWAPAAWLAMAMAVAMTATTACAPNGAGASGTTGTAVFDPAQALPDPKSYVGPSTAAVPEAAIVPITEQPSPALPAEVVDSQGTAVTITDVSRVLALDIYGTTSRIVFSLGLGGNVVGRDTSS